MFKCKNIVVKKFVQFFICVVDAELFKRVDSKVLKSKYVKYSQKPRRVLSWVGASVDVVYQPSKGARIESLGHRMPVLPGLEKKQIIRIMFNI